ncbi:MAG: thioredoxin domain-containing protein [Candidatus Paceibacterota bacterium]|jgi:protein-disulfide isomerase
MSNIIQHSHSSSSKDKKNGGSLFVIAISLLVIVLFLFGLNYFLNKNNKKNVNVIENVTDIRYTIGDPNAKIKLVEYADFQCPACSQLSAIFPEVFNYINNKYGSSTLSLTYKYFPLISIHKNALLSAYSTEAAKEQGKFWEMHDVLFAKQSEWSEALDAKSKIEGYAKDMGLDMAKFVLDRDSEKTKDIVNAALLEATKLQLNHTPTVFINGEEWTDLSLSAQAMEKFIEDKINSMDGVVATSTQN